VADEPVPHSHVFEEEMVDGPMSSEEDYRMSSEEEDDEEDVGFIQVEEGKTVYMRGSSTAPDRDLPVEQRPCIGPYGER
jgi:hypothetical protein